MDESLIAFCSCQGLQGLAELQGDALAVVLQKLAARDILSFSSACKSTRDNVQQCEAFWGEVLYRRWREAPRTGIPCYHQFLDAQRAGHHLRTVDPETSIHALHLYRSNDPKMILDVLPSPNLVDQPTLCMAIAVESCMVWGMDGIPLLYSHPHEQGGRTPLACTQVTQLHAIRSHTCMRSDYTIACTWFTTDQVTGDWAGFMLLAYMVQPDHRYHALSCLSILGACLGLLGAWYGMN